MDRQKEGGAVEDDAYAPKKRKSYVTKEVRQIHDGRRAIKLTVGSVYYS